MHLYKLISLSFSETFVTFLLLGIFVLLCFIVYEKLTYRTRRTRYRYRINRAYTAKLTSSLPFYRIFSLKSVVQWPVRMFRRRFLLPMIHFCQLFFSYIFVHILRVFSKKKPRIDSSSSLPTLKAKASVRNPSKGASISIPEFRIYNQKDISTEPLSGARNDENIKQDFASDAIDRCQVENIDETTAHICNAMLDKDCIVIDEDGIRHENIENQVFYDFSALINRMNYKLDTLVDENNSAIVIDDHLESDSIVTDNTSEKLSDLVVSDENDKVINSTASDENDKLLDSVASDNNETLTSFYSSPRTKKPNNYTKKFTTSSQRDQPTDHLHSNTCSNNRTIVNENYQQHKFNSKPYRDRYSRTSDSSRQEGKYLEYWKNLGLITPSPQNKVNSRRSVSFSNSSVASIPSKPINQQYSKLQKRPHSIPSNDINSEQSFRRNSGNVYRNFKNQSYHKNSNFSSSTQGYQSNSTNQKTFDSLNASNFTEKRMEQTWAFNNNLAHQVYDANSIPRVPESWKSKNASFPSSNNLNCNSSSIPQTDYQQLSSERFYALFDSPFDKLTNTPSLDDNFFSTSTWNWSPIDVTKLPRRNSFSRKNSYSSIFNSSTGEQAQVKEDKRKEYENSPF